MLSTFTQIVTIFPEVCQCLIQRQVAYVTSRLCHVTQFRYTLSAGKERPVAFPERKRKRCPHAVTYIATPSTIRQRADTNGCVGHRLSGRVAARYRSPSTSFAPSAADFPSCRKRTFTFATSLRVRLKSTRAREMEQAGREWSECKGGWNHRLDLGELYPWEPTSPARELSLSLCHASRWKVFENDRYARQPQLDCLVSLSKAKKASYFISIASIYAGTSTIFKKK